MKYVIFNQKGLLHPVLFADHTSHAQITIEGAEPVSAGFVRFSKTLHLPECYGFSDSLGLKSRQEDEKIIRQWQLNSGTADFIDFDTL